MAKKQKRNCLLCAMFVSCMVNRMRKCPKEQDDKR